MLDYDQALRVIADLPSTSMAWEELPLAAASGRILATDICMQRDQPPFDRATMDGYAIAPLRDLACYAIQGAIYAGEIPPQTVAPGHAWRITTGSSTPPGCAVVPIECCQVEKTAVNVADPALRVAGRNVARCGEDAANGSVVVPKGSVLSPMALAAAAMAGRQTVMVYAAPQIGLITTGDEINRSDGAGIADSNGPLLQAMLAQFQLTAIPRRVGDTDSAMTAAITASPADILITTGGVSMGDRDCVPAALAAAGFHTVFHKVQIQPGKPVLLMQHADGRLALGLPGNPVGVLATAHLFLLPLLAALWPGFQSGWITLPLAADAHNPKPRRLFRPARLSAKGCRVLPWNGSGDLLSAAAGDGLVDLGSARNWEAGAAVSFLPYLGQRSGTGPYALARLHADHG